MTSALAERGGMRLFADPPAATPRSAPRRPAPRVQTLDELLSSTWSAVAAGRATPCPVCRGALRPRPTAGATVAGARCGDCGAQLE